MQAEIQTLKSEATRSGNSSPAGSQISDLAPGNALPAAKRRRTVPVEPNSDNEDDDDDEEDSEEVDLRPTESRLVQLSEEAGAFIEAAFKSKLKNADRTARSEKFGIPESRWLRCPQLDPVVKTTVSVAAKRSDRAASRLQNFWLDAVNPLVYVLEKAEELQLPPEVISAVQTSLQLLGNANAHNSMARRKELLTHMNPKLKELVDDMDFKEAPPVLFGDNFATLAKERLEAAAALTKTLGSDKGRQDFSKSHSQRNRGRGGGSHHSGHYKQRGWQPSNSKTAPKQPAKK